MSNYSFKEFPSLLLAKEFLQGLKELELKAKERIDIRDLLYRVSRYGLDPMMLGSRLEIIESDGSGFLQVECIEGYLRILFEECPDFKYLIRSISKVKVRSEAS